MSKRNDCPAFLSGTGEMARRIRDHDWETTALGSPALWPAPLKTTVRMALTTRHPIFIFWGPERMCLYNDAYSRSLGPDRHPAMLGMPGQRAWPDIWHIIGPQIEFVSAGSGATWYENALVPIVRNGRLEDVYWTYSYGPIDDETAPNGVGGVLVICSETTETVRMQNALREQRDLLAEYCASAPTIMAKLEGRGHRFTFTNASYDRFVGGREVLGRTVGEALPEAVEQGFVKILDRVFETGVPYKATGALFRIAAADQASPAERYIDFVYQPFRGADGKIAGIYVNGFDSTDRELASRALAKAQERIQLAMESSTLGTFDFDFDAQSASLSRSAMRLFGVETPELPMHVLAARIHPEDRDRVIAAVDRVRAEGGEFRLEFRLIDSAHDPIWLDVAGKTVDEATEDRRGANRVTGILWDVSEHHRMMETLKQNDRRKDEFVATLAHELRNPLAPIRLASELLQRPDLAEDRRAWCVDMIARNSRTMKLLLDDLLDVSRVANGRLALKRTPVSVSTVFSNAIETARPLIDERAHELIAVPPSDPIQLDVDPLRISQVLTNLLTNAAKYTDKGGRIELRFDREGDSCARIEVRDNGIGIEGTMLESVFEMFRQDDTASELSQGGLGIGLALSRGLVLLHGGTLTARSEGRGKGSTFVLRLPGALHPQIRL